MDAPPSHWPSLGMLPVWDVHPNFISHLSISLFHALEVINSLVSGELGKSIAKDSKEKYM